MVKYCDNISLTSVLGGTTSLNVTLCSRSVKNGGSSFTSSMVTDTDLLVVLFGEPPSVACCGLEQIQTANG